MKDLTPAHDPSPQDEDGKYPKARRAYRFLGVVHFVLITAGITAQGLENGTGLGWSLLGGLLMGGLFLAVFEHLAREHYHGRVPGKEAAE